ncbi:MAG TPA: molybdopterin-dependent oxidoreductase [Pyrinomonadaceae bacterium]|jgi:hypothetical protein
MSEENLKIVEDEEIKTEDAEIAEAKAETGKEKNTAEILGEKTRLSVALSDEKARQEMKKHSRRGFLIGGAAAVFGYLGYGWLRKPESEWIFKDAFRFNENVSRLYYSPKNLAPEFSKEKISADRVNGGEGLSENFNAAEWRLRVGGLANRADDLILTLDDIKALPRVEMTTELKCIEGWSVVVNWAGARFSDFVQKYPPQFTKYVSIVTPDESYYVGWDMPSVLHPQTLLAYEMNGAPLTLPHGAPLRLASPTKYGIKQIKRIGRIEFTDERPRDFWAESGYDWYSSH